jgi:predicted small metal-binding protein
MTSEQKRSAYQYRCTDYGRVDCDFEHETADADELRAKVRDHIHDMHRPEDFDPEALEALIMMQTIEP